MTADPNEAAECIADCLAQADACGGDAELTWYGYVSLADVRELVDAVLNPSTVFASGGTIPGYSPSDDRVPVTLDPGFVFMMDEP